MSKNSSDPATRKGRTLDLIARALAVYLEHKVKGDGRAKSHYSQYNSPLGRSRHLELAKQGILPAEKVGGRMLIRRDVVDLYLANLASRGLS